MTIPSTSAIATVDGKRRGSSWMAGHTLYPYPVYVAELADGTTRRMSFWQESGKSWNFERGRKLCGDFTYWARGYIEHDGRRFMDNGQTEPAKRKRGPTATQLKALLASVLDGDHSAIEQARELLAA